MHKLKRALWPLLLILLLCACGTGRVEAPPAPEAEAAVQTSAAADASTAGTAAPAPPAAPDAPEAPERPAEEESPAPADLSTLPPYSGTPYVTVGGNEPAFTPEERASAASFETYSPLDALGRCGAAFANIGRDLMPTGERGAIGSVKPSGWQTVRYSGVVDGGYLYNRCHLIGYQLTAENANRQNLITGTRYLNVDGMLPFENLVADYIKETGNHVLYRVTPVFTGENLVADGVQMEALSLEDGGEGVLFNVFCYNVQPGVVIDYATGESRLEESAPDPGAPPETSADARYILNTGTRKFHDPSCPDAEKIKAENREEYSGAREAVIAQGYSPCGRCKP